MKNRKFALVTLLVTVSVLFTVIACNRNIKASTSGYSANSTIAEAILVGTKPDTLVRGKITFTEKNSVVIMKMEVFIPTKANQTVALHIHENGACGDMGKAAGGHWNPTNQSHGKWGIASYHLGDIGNFTLDSRGNGIVTMETNLWAIGGNGLNNIVGKGIIIHGGLDDYITQPTGNAGTRIGCGIIAMAKI